MSKEFVLDCSATLPWLFSDEATAETACMLDGVIHGDCVWVPGLWHLEVANSLLMSVRNRRVQQQQADTFIAKLSDFKITTDHETVSQAWTNIRALAQQHHLSAYDAAYLELALRRRLPLATLDKPLAVAAKKSGVKLLL